jgi:hypothetical protein
MMLVWARMRDPFCALFVALSCLMLCRLYQFLVQKMHHVTGPPTAWQCPLGAYDAVLLECIHAID